MLNDTLIKQLLNKKLLIFDFDGTLADTSALHAQAFAETLAPFGIEINYSLLAGRKTLDAFIVCFDCAGLPTPDNELLAKLTINKQLRVRELIANSVEPLPGVDKFLAWAKQHYRMAMVTSGSRGTVELALEKLGYTGWFDPILFAEDVIHAKPHPEGFLRVLEITNISANDALIFEDSEAGFKAANLAGLHYLDARTVFITP
ncbi:MAG: HAD family hydrolase [Methylomonas sp.]